MLEDILEKQENPIILLDSSAITIPSKESISELLYSGWNGLMGIQADMINKNIQRIGKVEELMAKHPFVVLGEVVNEIKVNLDNMNENYKFFRKTDGDSKMIEDIGFRRFKNKNNARDREEKINSLGELSERLYGFIRSIDRTEHKPKFQYHQNPYCNLNNILNEEVKGFMELLKNRGNNAELKFFEDRLNEKGVYLFDKKDYSGDDHFLIDPKIYSGFLSSALYKSRNNRRRDVERALKLKSSAGQGFILNTDVKLISAAYALSCDPSNCSTVILSNDFGILRVLDKVKESHNYFKKRGYDVPNIKSCPIFYTPDLMVANSKSNSNLQTNSK